MGKGRGERTIKGEKGRRGPSTRGRGRGAWKKRGRERERKREKREEDRKGGEDRGRQRFSLPGVRRAALSVRRRRSGPQLVGVGGWSMGGGRVPIALLGANSFNEGVGALKPWVFFF